MVRDVVVIGGGMVGAATAVGLAQLGLTVTLIEAYPPTAYDVNQKLDLRVSAINLGSEQLLQRLGALDSLNSMRSACYSAIETWEFEQTHTRFNAEHINAPYLGRIVENRLVQLSLWQQFELFDNLEVICPAKVIKFQRADQVVSVILDSGQAITTQLLVGADGATSQVRKWAKIDFTGWDYAQSAMLINIKTAFEPEPITWQKFTPNGPRAFLPLPEKHASLVWYDDDKRIDKLASLSNDLLAEKIKAHFPPRLEHNFQVIDKASFNLSRRHANRYFSENIVLLGDAAHTINPLAGQGVNLGFKDVKALLNSVSSHIAYDKPWWHQSALKTYQKARYKDNLLMMSAMDLFYFTFSNNVLPVKLMRNAALKVANINSPLKQQVLRYAMGI